MPSAIVSSVEEMLVRRIIDGPHTVYSTTVRASIPAVWFRIPAHDNIVIDVQPELLELNPRRKSKVVTNKTPEKTH